MACPAVRLAGTIQAQIHGAVQAGGYNGTVNMTLSTNGTMTACDNSTVSGATVTNGQAVLVGQAPVDGLPAHCWLALLDVNVTPVGF